MYFYFFLRVSIAFSCNTHCCGTTKFNISDGGKEGTEVTSEADISLRDSRFPRTRL